MHINTITIEEMLTSTLSFVERLPVIPMLLFFFAMAFLQSSVSFVPGDMLLILGSCISGVVQLPGGSWSVFLIYWLGTLTACLCMYELGYRSGDRILRFRPLKRYFVSVNRGGKVTNFLHKGPIVFLVTKFIPGINVVALVLGGIAKVRRKPTYIFVGLASFLHNLALFMIGRTIGNNLPKIIYIMSEYRKAASTIFALLCAAIIAIFLIRYGGERGKKERVDGN